MMTEEEFSNYWKQYILIEKEFNTSTKYVAIDPINFTTYSIFFAKLLLQIGSEADTIAKELCLAINPSSTSNNINQYKAEILTRFPDFSTVIVECKGINLYPWKNSSQDTPVWWKTYNGVKHNRNKIEQNNLPNYKLANLEIVLNALAGLYQEELYLYSLISHDPKIETPMTGSRLFKLKGAGWEEKRYYLDANLYVDENDGCLYIQTSDFLYSEI